MCDPAMLPGACGSILDSEECRDVVEWVDGARRLVVEREAAYGATLVAATPSGPRS